MCTCSCAERRPERAFTISAGAEQPLAGPERRRGAHLPHITTKTQLEPEQVLGILTVDTEFAKAAAFGVLTQLLLVLQHIDFKK